MFELIRLVFTNTFGRTAYWVAIVLCMQALLNVLPAQEVLEAQEAKEVKEVKGVSHGRLVRVASISILPEKLNVSGNAARLEEKFRQAALAGAKLAVAPEGVLEGYVVNEIIAGKIDAQQMLEVAQSIDSPVIKRFRCLARELQICLVFGFAERVNEEVYNCAVFIDDQGQVAGKYHKMQFAEGNDPQWWFNRMGQSSRAFDTPLGRCGILICNDRWNPDLAKIPALDGAQFLLIPAFGSRSEKQDAAVLSRARENQLPLIEANVGVSMIVSDGEIKSLSRDEDGITYGEIMIPPARSIEVNMRDDLQKKFLDWRAQEMPQRKARHLQSPAQPMPTEPKPAQSNNAVP